MDIVKESEDLSMVVATVDESGKTVSVAGEIESNENADDKAVRFWAGASFENRQNAPFRVLQDGSVIATQADIQGNINALSGTIGGFEIADGRIGVVPGDPNVEYNGVGITNNMIKYSDYEDLNEVRKVAAFGDNVNPGGDKNILARFEYTDNQTDEENIQSGIALLTKFRPGYQHPWYIQRAWQNDGNVFSVGGHCFWDDTYIGAASSDVVEVFISRTQTYVFNEVTASNQGVRLPNKSAIDNIVNNANVSGLLHFLVPAEVSNKITLLGVENGVIRDNNGAVFGSGNGQIELTKGDVCILRYYNGNYYIVALNR